MKINKDNMHTSSYCAVDRSIDFSFERGFSFPRNSKRGIDITRRDGDVAASLHKPYISVDALIVNSIT